MGRTDFSDQFRKIIIYHKCIGGSGVRLYDEPDLKLFILVGWDRSSFVSCLVHRSSTDDHLLQISSGVV